MSTIPSTSNSLRVPYTVIGENKISPDRKIHNVTAVVLNRGERVYKENQFEELEALGFSEVISIEPPNSFYNVEAYARRFKHMRFIVPEKETTAGESINLAIRESNCPLVLVLWNNMHIANASLSKKVLERALASGNVCTVPTFYSKKNDPLPVIHQPAFYKRKRLKIINSQPAQSNLYTIFPHDYCGFYNRQLFEKMGGYDHSFNSPYWQLMDFGLRVYMWGGKISADLTSRLSYLQDVSPINQSINKDYSLFYLKTIALRFKKDFAYLPGVRFFTFLKLQKVGFFDSLKVFRSVRKWTKLNKFRFIQSAISVVKLWESLN